MIATTNTTKSNSNNNKKKIFSIKVDFYFYFLFLFYIVVITQTRFSILRFKSNLLFFFNYYYSLSVVRTLNSPLSFTTKMSGKAPAKLGGGAADPKKVIAEVAGGNKSLKHVSAPQTGLSDAEKQAYLEEKGKK